MQVSLTWFNMISASTVPGTANKPPTKGMQDKGRATMLMTQYQRGQVDRNGIRPNAASCRVLIDVFREPLDRGELK
jgi:hypothetical protein